MRRTTSLATAALAGLVPALVLLTGPTATGAGETCRGEAATIVGSPEADVTGTPGDDVIVSHAAWSVDAGDGDDLICLSPAEGEQQGNVVEVHAGAGDDVVISEGEHNNSDTDLGPGRDEFHGGGWEDRVEASLDDIVVADRGDDMVDYTIARNEDLPARIGTVTAERTSGWIKVTAPGRRLTIDARSGTIRLSGRVVTRFEVSPRMLFGVAQTVELVGTPGVDRLGTAACGRSTLVGRGGDDEFVALGSRATPNRDCPRRRIEAVGGGGDDLIHGTRFADDLRGGGGKDVLRGHGGDDIVDGGSGRDRADGGTGSDTCRAERETHCER